MYISNCALWEQEDIPCDGELLSAVEYVKVHMEMLGSPQTLSAFFVVTVMQFLSLLHQAAHYGTYTVSSTCGEISEFALTDHKCVCFAVLYCLL